MQDRALATAGYGQSISRATGNNSEHGSSGGGYKTQRSKKGVTILNNPECRSRTLGTECGNNAKGKSDSVGGGIRPR